jgi:hypothetical protein
MRFWNEFPVDIIELGEYALENELRPASNGDMCSHDGCNMARERWASNKWLLLLELFLRQDLLADIFVEFHGCGELQL